MKDRDMLSYIEFYTLKRYGYYYSFFNKQERGASLDYLSNIPLACIFYGNKNKVLRRFSYILKKVVKNEFLFITKREFLFFLDKLSKVNLIKVKKDLTKLM